MISAKVLEDVNLVWKTDLVQGGSMKSHTITSRPLQSDGNVHVGSVFGRKME